MTRTERLLAILQMLRQHRQPVTATQIAERFAMSERTAYRDIATLAGQGAAIVGEAGIGFVLRDDFFIPPLAFDAEEAEALMLGLRFVLRRGDDGLSGAAGRAFAKLATVLPARFGDEAAARNALVVAPSPPAHALIAVRRAIADGRKARMSYEDGQGGRSDRVIWPLLLGWFDRFEMVAAWCELRQGFRHFRIDRVGSIEILDAVPPRPRHLLLADYRKLEPGIAL